jgi:uncharacterized membrane protein YfcA
VWRQLAPLFVVTFVGSIAGALLLLETPERTFVRVIPVLLGGATLLFAFGGKLTAFVHERHAPSPIVAIALQLAVAIYIGYFGAGAGILMLALFAVLGMKDIHTMNAFKSLLATLANGVAVVTFIIAGKVVWSVAVLMLIAASAGGYVGAWYAQKLDPQKVRWVVIALGCGMTLYFALRR